MDLCIWCIFIFENSIVKLMMEEIVNIITYYSYKWLIQYSLITFSASHYSKNLYHFNII